MSSCKHPRKTNDYSFGEGYVQFCIECGTKFYWQNEPVTAVAEEKCARCKGSLNWEGTCCYKCTLELTDPQKEEQKGNLRRRCKCHEIKDGDMLETCEDCDGVKKVMPAKEQKGCCQCPEPKRDLSSAVVPFTCPCSCHKKQCDACDFGSCLVHNTERKEKHCFCGNLSDPNYAHHPKECVFIGSYVKPDSPQEKCDHKRKMAYSDGTTFCWACREFVSEYYTKSEIDERMKEIVNFLAYHWGEKRGMKDLKSRFFA